MTNRKGSWSLSAEPSRCCKGRVRVSFGSAVLARCISRGEAWAFELELRDARFALPKIGAGVKRASRR